MARAMLRLARKESDDSTDFWDLQCWPAALFDHRQIGIWCQPAGDENKAGKMPNEPQRRQLLLTIRNSFSAIGRT